MAAGEEDDELERLIRGLDAESADDAIRRR
jgi:hypothetical protein